MASFREGRADLEVTRLNAAPGRVARRLIREIIRQVKQDLLGISFAHVEAIRELAASPLGRGRRQIAGLQVFRSLDWLRFAKPGAATPTPDWQFPIAVPGCYPLPFGTSSLTLERISNDGVYNGSLDALDGERAGEFLVLRNWRAGDRYRRQGHIGVEKVKRLFEERRVPLWERRNWPIIVVGDVVAWASRFGPAADFAVRPDSRHGFHDS